MFPYVFMYTLSSARMRYEHFFQYERVFLLMAHFLCKRSKNYLHTHQCTCSSTNEDQERTGVQIQGWDKELNETVYFYWCFFFLQNLLLIFCPAFRYQSGKKFVYLPLLFIDELSNRVKDLVVGDSLIPTWDWPRVCGHTARHVRVSFRRSTAARRSCLSPFHTTPSLWESCASGSTCRTPCTPCSSSVSSKTHSRSCVSWEMIKLTWCHLGKIDVPTAAFHLVSGHAHEHSFVSDIWIDCALRWR